MTLRRIAGRSRARSAIGALLLASCNGGTEPDPPDPADARQPTIVITSPARAAMLMSGTNDPSPVTVTGEACHESQAITSLTINGVAQSVGGDAHCETFSTTVNSPWGHSTITVVARNALGREATHVQSWLRAPEYFPPLLATDPGGRIANAALLRFSPSGVVKLQSLINGLAAPFSLGTTLSDLLLNAEPAQPICIIGGRPVTETGYRVTRGTVSVGMVQPSSQLVSAQTMRQSVNFAGIVVPLTVTGYRKTSCQAVETATATGSMTVQSVVGRSEITFGVGVNGITTASQIVGSTVGTTAVNLDLSGISFLTTADRDAIVSQVVPLVTGALGNEVDIIVHERFALEFGRLVTAAHLPEQRMNASGLDLVHAANMVVFQNQGLTIGFGAQAVPQTPRTGAPPERGSIRNATAVWPSLDPSSDVGYAVTDDLLNQVFWAAWQAGRLDDADLAGTAAGLSLSMRSLLPPVLSRAAGGRVHIGWGDAQLDATIDPAVFGSEEETSTTPVTVRAYATTIVDAVPAYDSVAGTFALGDVRTEVALQIGEHAEVSLNGVAVRAAISAAIDAAARERLAAVFAGTPVAQVALTGFAFPEAFRLPVWYNGLTRDANLDRVDGVIAAPVP